MPYFENNNISLFYRQKGEGELLLILPGNTASSACHEEELNHFGQDFHTVSLDFRGTGHSGRTGNMSVEWWDLCADDLAKLVSFLGRQDCYVMGTSGGANIALLFAIKYPELVKGVIADSCAEIYNPDSLREEVSDRSARTIEQVEFWKYANGEDWESVVDADSELLLELADKGGNIYNGRLSEINCPVLFTGSLRDSFIKDIQKQSVEIARQIEASSVFLFNGGGHPLMWTTNGVFKKVASEFLAALR